MYIPFEEIKKDIDELKQELVNIKQSKSYQIEIIDRKELRMRLGLSEPTAIRWEKKGKIPSIRIGGNVRYNWPAVIHALENKPYSHPKDNNNLKAISQKNTPELKMDRKSRTL